MPSSPEGIKPQEKIIIGGHVVAHLFRMMEYPKHSKFLTPDEAALQVGYVVYPAASVIQPHAHLPVERHITGTAEVLLVCQGRCWADFYDDCRRLSESRELRTGDILVLLGGGHGFRMEEDTVLLEMKQGPYLGDQDKERFTP